jgi:hypothetical protein
VVSSRVFHALTDYLWKLAYKRIMPPVGGARGWVKLRVRRPPTSYPLGTVSPSTRVTLEPAPGRYPGLLPRARV